MSRSAIRDDLLRAVEQIHLYPDLYRRVRIRGRRKAEAFRASRVYPEAGPRSPARPRGVRNRPPGVVRLRWRRRGPTEREKLGLTRLEPVSRIFGFDRGKPVDRWYIERFLAAHAADVRGRVLEVAEPTYTQWYGGDDVTESDVLHAAPGNEAATVVGDLVTGEGLPREAYDCFVMTQTLQVIYDVAAAVRGTRERARPGRRPAGDGAGHQPDQPRGPPRLGRLVALHVRFRPPPVRATHTGPRTSRWRPTATSCPPPASCTASPPRS